jgi:hypothetical protein
MQRGTRNEEREGKTEAGEIKGICEFWRGFFFFLGNILGEIENSLGEIGNMSGKIGNK